MKARSLLLKIYGEQRDGQWSLVCLDFSLAAQADSIEEAKQLLEGQIKEYLREAQDEDQEFAPLLISRRAPLKYWAKWWAGRIYCKIFRRQDKQHKAFRRTMPLVPA
ncbi:hypothetical protein [Collimonas pratensis]|uniref:hypothetical protein n=1 Tax=Collimonas pratensis TaxID=279113 RepID=UPI0007839247|nr:hypothetical protein [Collimonas pratensis]